MKTEFTHDLDLIIKKVKNKEMFSLVRFADGEYNIFMNKFIDFTKKDISEFKYDPSESKYSNPRDRLVDSIKYRDRSYFVGIISPCCYYPYNELYKWMKSFSGQPESNLTWASIFCYSNFDKTLNELIPEFSNYNVVLVANKKSNISMLPFNIVKQFKVDSDAWVENDFLIYEIKRFVIENKINNYLFLFCAGPLSKFLIHELHQINSNNIYLDLGAALDIFLFNGKPTRKFQWRKEFMQHHCIWY